MNMSCIKLQHFAQLEYVLQHVYLRNCETYPITRGRYTAYEKQVTKK